MVLEPVIPRPDSIEGQPRGRGPTTSCFAATVLVEKFKNWFRPQASWQEVQNWIKSIDINNDGIISQQELEQALRGFHMCLADWKAWLAVKHADVNRNGQIDDDREEINKLISYARWHWGYAIRAQSLNRYN
ncbi:hypothetical protein ACLOJK_013704 [Asimina triloba]